MANHHHHLLLLLLCITTLSNGQTPTVVYPITCSQPSTIDTCDSDLYVVPGDLSTSEIAAVYSANASLIKSIARPTAGKSDFLVRVPCGCKAAGNGTAAYFHDTNYTVRAGDTPNGITVNVFSGLAWNVGGGQGLVAGDVIPVHLPCGCDSGGGGREVVVSYVVQPRDTLSSIARLLDSNVGEIERLNEKLTANPEFLSAGWILFVPMGVVAATPPPPPRGGGAKAQIT